MKHRKVHLAVFCVALAALVALASFAARPGSGQSKSNDQTPAVAPSSGSGLQPTAAVRERRVATGADAAGASLFGAAATQNSSLRYELGWEFGGRQQHGWYIYAPLISRLIETDKDATSNDFASALSRWQKASGLPASGVLDDTTLYQMVSAWQGVRLKDKTPAQAGQMLVAPVSDFYDTSRPDELRQVERETYAAYKRMVAAACADPALNLKHTAAGELAHEEKFFKIVSAFRSPEYQANLRRQSPNSGRAGLAINSPHFTGRALDLYVGGEPVETKDANRAIQVQTTAYRWLVRNADKFGFRPYYYEPWHWEYVGTPATAAK
ncbi:MAG TPA: D-alanyl-D-alanine carboxypeptidase family protein [Pyrinomonadaceae bacterium]|nr:D-alanyl-D-alanine carboxypeptidase family protein [Pyrinomonadaceae bacterium]